MRYHVSSLGKAALLLYAHINSKQQIHTKCAKMKNSSKGSVHSMGQDYPQLLSKSFSSFSNVK